MPAILLNPPLSEPVTLQDLKTALRLENTIEDDFLTAQITAARSFVEHSTRLVLMPQRWRVSYSRWPERRKIELPLSPVREIVQIKVYDGNGDGTLISPASYFLESANQPPTLLLQAALRAPTAFAQGIEIDLDCGFLSASAVPAPLKLAITRLAGQLYEQRTDNAFSVASGAIEELIAPYRVVWP